MAARRTTRSDAVGVASCLLPAPELRVRIPAAANQPALGAEQLLIVSGRRFSRQARPSVPTSCKPLRWGRHGSGPHAPLKPGHVVTVSVEQLGSLTPLIIAGAGPVPMPKSPPPQLTRNPRTGATLAGKSRHDAVVSPTQRHRSPQGRRVPVGGGRARSRWSGPRGAPRSGR